MKENPVELLRPKSPPYTKRREKSLKKPSPIKLNIVMAVRNMRVNLAKSMMVVVGVFGCTSLMCAAFGMLDSIDYGVNLELSEFFDYDLKANYTARGDYQEELSAISWISEYEQFSQNGTMVSAVDEGGLSGSSYAGDIFVFGDSKPIHTIELPETGNGVTLSQKIATQISVEVGDMVSFTFLGNEYQATVGRIEHTFITFGVFTSFEELGIEPTYNICGIRMNEGMTLTQGYNLIKKQSFVQDAYWVQRNAVNQISSVYGGVEILSWIMEIFAVFMALAVLYNLASMNYRDRVRDMIIMKTMGFDRLNVSASLIMETLFLTLLGVAGGLGFGWSLLYWIFDVNSMAIVDFFYVIDPISYVISFLISFGVGILVSVILCLLTDRIKLSESLKEIE